MNAVTAIKSPDFSRSPSGRIVQVFFGADMRCSHKGLGGLAKQHKIEVDALTAGQYVVFINKAKTYVKIYAASGVLAAWKSSRGRIDMRVISQIPKSFLSSGEPTYDNALRKVLEVALAKKH